MRVVLSQLWLLCSVVFSLRSNMPVAPWGARPAHGRQRAPAWDARALRDVSSSWLTPHAAFAFFFPTVWLSSRRPELPPAPCSGEIGLAFVPSPCSRGMALQQCPEEAGVQKLALQAAARALPWAWAHKGVSWAGASTGGQGEGRRDSPAVLQHPLPGQALCVCQERGSAKDGLEGGACVFPDAQHVPSSAGAGTELSACSPRLLSHPAWALVSGIRAEPATDPGGNPP